MSHDIPDSCQACCRVHEFVLRTVDGDGMADRESLCFGERSVVFNTCCFGQAGRGVQVSARGFPRRITCIIPKEGAPGRSLSTTSPYRLHDRSRDTFTTSFSSKAHASAGHSMTGLARGFRVVWDCMDMTEMKWKDTPLCHVAIDFT